MLDNVHTYVRWYFLPLERKKVNNKFSLVSADYVPPINVMSCENKIPSHAKVAILCARCSCFMFTGDCFKKRIRQTVGN